MNARIARWHILSSIKFNCIFRDACGSFSVIFTLTEVHPHAEIAAESAEFGGAAGLFWEMHENQSRLSIATIFLIGAALGLPE